MVSVIRFLFLVSVLFGKVVIVCFGWLVFFEWFLFFMVWCGIRVNYCVFGFLVGVSVLGVVSR